MAIRLKENETMQDLVERLASSFDIVNDIAPVAYWYENLHENGRIIDIHFSQRMRDILGYKSVEEFPDELNTLMTFTHPDDVHIMLDGAIAAGTGKSPKYDVEYRIRMASGAYMWCNATGMLVKDQNGTTVGMYGAFVNIDTKKAKEKAARLADNYEKVMSADVQVMYYLDLAEGKATLLQGDEDAKKFMPIFNTSSVDDMFANFNSMYVDAAVVEEDRERVKAVMNPDNIFSTLKDHNSISVSFRVRRNLVDPVYTEMRFFKAEETDGKLTAVILSFRQADEETVRALNLSRQLQNEMMKEMVGVDDLFLINLQTDTRKTIRDSRHSNEITDEGKHSETFEAYVNTFVYEADREKMRKAVSPASMLERLKKEPEYRVEYREIASGMPMWYEMKLVRYSDTEVLQGFRACDKEVMNRNVANTLIEEYDALYIVDLDMNEVRTIRRPEFSFAKELAEYQKYDKTVLKFAEIVDPKYRQDWIRFSSVKYMKEYMADEDHREYVFELPGAENTMLRFSVDVLGRENGEAKRVLLSFMGIDDYRAQAILMHRQMAEQAQKSQVDIETITGMASEYLSLYHINLDNHEYRIYQIDDTRLADTKQLIEEYPDYFEMLHQFALHSVHPDDRQIFLDMNYESVREILAHRKKYTARYRRDYGSGYMWSEMDMVKNEERNEPARVIIIGFAERDQVIRNEMQQQEQLETALVEAQSASMAKTAFLSNMSHDIRTPLNAILGFTAMTQKCLDDRMKALGYLGKINNAGNNLLQLVNQVLDMSRIESGKVVLNEEPADVVEKAYEMTEMIGYSAHAKNIKVTTHINPVIHRKIYADCPRMNQVILNILGNAVKYTPEGGHINYSIDQVDCDRPGYATYVFTTEDNGIGMSKEYQKTLFEPFTREATSTVSKIQGTGLGMSIVKKLVDLMGGKIDVESEQGKGTRIAVTVSFRIVEEDEEVFKPTCEQISQGGVLNGKHVLLVEDNEMNREIAAMILNEQGVIVHTADDGDVAVNKVKGHVKNGEWKYYDFILMDVQMPRMNGYDATRLIRQIYEPTGFHIPIIALSANAFDEDRQRSREAGMDAHVAKPIDVSELWETLVRFI